MASRRDEARKLAQEYEKQRQIELAASSAKHAAENKLAELAQDLKPDPECSHSMTTTFNGVETCVWCYTGDKRALGD